MCLNDRPVPIQREENEVRGKKGLCVLKIFSSRFTGPIAIEHG